MQGHNFALPDCLQYLFERAGAFGTLDYWNFAALTGDVCAQVYDRGRADGCEYCVSGYLAGPDYLSRVFGALGYARTPMPAGRTSAASPTPSPAASRRRSTAACPCWR